MEDKELNLDQQYASSMESSDGGSDSSVSDGLPVHLQYLADKIPKKKKRLKTKKERDLQHKNAEESKKMSATPQATTTQEAPVINTNKDNVTNNNININNNNKLQADLQSVSAAPQNVPHRQKTAKHSSSGRRTREERSGSTGGGGIPTFVQERVEERTQRKNDSYLEALTNAYLRSGVLTPSDAGHQPKELPHFRYTGINRPMPHVPVNLDGLCPHHEKTFAAQYVSNHLQHFSYPDDLEEMPHYKYSMRKSSSGRSDARSPLSSDRRPPSQRHIVELSAAQQRHQDLMNQEHRKHSGMDRALAGSPIKQHPPPFDQTLDRDKPHDFVRPRTSNSALSTGSAKSRTSSAASHPRIRSARSHASGEDALTGMNGMPSALLVNGSHDIMPDIASSQSGRILKSSSTPGMEGVASAPARNQYSPNAEISHTLEDIQEIRSSLRDSTRNGNFSPTTGKYINEIVKQAEDEIEALTAEIQSDLHNEDQVAADFHQERREFSSTNGRKSRTASREDSTRSQSSYNPNNHAMNYHSTTHANQNYVPSAGQQVLKRKSIKFRGQYTDEEIDERIRQSQSKINMSELAKRLSGLESTDSGKEDGDEEGRLGRSSNNHSSTRQNERGKSPKGPRQIASPTKISLMISRGHQDQEQKGKQFYPSGARPNNRPPLLRNVSNFPRRK